MRKLYCFSGVFQHKKDPKALIGKGSLFRHHSMSECVGEHKNIKRNKGQHKSIARRLLLWSQVFVRKSQ